MNNKGNDLATNSDNLYQANNLGSCVDITLTEEDFERNINDQREVTVEAINESYDGLSITGTYTVNLLYMYGNFYKVILKNFAVYLI